jgi:ATP-binding cassette subfamily C protein CydD
MSEQSVRFLKGHAKTSGRLLRLAVGLGSVGGWLIIAQAWCLALVASALIIDGRGLGDVMGWLWAILALLLVRVTLVYASERVAFSATAQIKLDLRRQLLARLEKLGPMYLSRGRSGEVTTILTDAVEGLEAYYARYLPAMSLAAWIPLSILGVVLPLDWQSFLVMLVTAPLIPFFMVLIGRGAERLNQQQWQHLTRLGGRFLDVVQGLTTLKLFNATHREALVIEAYSEDYRQSTMKVLRIAFLSSLALEFLASVSIAIVAVLIGFRLLFGQMEFIHGFFILLLAPEFYLPLRSLGTHYHGRMQAIAAAEQIADFLGQPEPSDQLAGQAIEAPGQDISIDQVTFSYGDRRALEQVSFHIGAGEKVALVGPSGAGKSTVVNLLLGFIQPDSGSIRINQVDLKNIDLESWRRRIAWIPQAPRLFHGTLRDNLTLGLAEVEDGSIAEALKNAEAAGFVDALPKGLDTLVGEGGQGLSGGEIQRLALARAFLRDARLLILDEPTAHLDRHNEKLVQRALNRFAEQRSVLTIAHRLDTIQQADRIVVLANGRIAEQGDHRQLLGGRGLYHRLVNASEGLA